MPSDITMRDNPCVTLLHSRPGCSFSAFLPILYQYSMRPRSSFDGSSSGYRSCIPLGIVMAPLLNVRHLYVYVWPPYRQLVSISPRNFQNFTTGSAVARYRSMISLDTMQWISSSSSVQVC